MAIWKNNFLRTYQDLAKSNVVIIFQVVTKTCRKWGKIGDLEWELLLAGKLFERDKKMTTYSLNVDKSTGYSEWKKYAIPYIEYE